MAKAVWNRKDFGSCLKVDNVSREGMCAGNQFQVDGTETENSREEKLVVMPEGLYRLQKIYVGWNAVDD